MKGTLLRSRRGQSDSRWIFGVLVILGVLFFLYQNRPRGAAPGQPVRLGPPGPSGRPGALPAQARKAQPQATTFQGCPPEGDGGDPEMNRLKNRVDEGSYVPVSFDSVAQLSWPHSIERQKRENWSSEDMAAVQEHEGTPVAVEGYLAGAKESGPESCNCHGADHEMRDWHLWLAKSPGEDRSGSIVVETTPRVRDRHPDWTLRGVKRIARDGEHVRISGWLFLDPEHPDQIGKTRGTIWEIHPIMKIEVEQDGRWVSLDDMR